MAEGDGNPPAPPYLLAHFRPIEESFTLAPVEAGFGQLRAPHTCEQKDSIRHSSEPGGLHPIVGMGSRGPWEWAGLHCPSEERGDLKITWGGPGGGLCLPKQEGGWGEALGRTSE